VVSALAQPGDDGPRGTVGRERILAPALRRVETPEGQVAHPRLPRLADRLRERPRAAERVLGLSPGAAGGGALALDPPRPALVLPRARGCRGLEALIGKPPCAPRVSLQERKLTEARAGVHRVYPRHPT